LSPSSIQVLQPMSMQDIKCPATRKVDLMDNHMWNRFESEASTILPLEGCDDWIRGESDGSEDLDSRCQNEVHQEQVCPEVITSTSQDWRPIAVALRQALHANANVKKAEAKTLVNPCFCPAMITADTLDWRPLTARLRNQLAAAQTLSKPRNNHNEEPNGLMAYTAAVLLLLAILVSWICLPGAVARVLTSLTVSAVLVGSVLPGQLLALFAACVLVPGIHIFGTAGFLSLMAPPI